jgi:hypothetical protein
VYSPDAVPAFDPNLTPRAAIPPPGDPPDAPMRLPSAARAPGAEHGAALAESANDRAPGATRSARNAPAASGATFYKLAIKRQDLPRMAAGGGRRTVGRGGAQAGAMAAVELVRGALARQTNDYSAVAAARHADAAVVTFLVANKALRDALVGRGLALEFGTEVLTAPVADITTGGAESNVTHLLVTDLNPRWTRAEIAVMLLRALGAVACDVGQLTAFAGMRPRVHVTVDKAAAARADNGAFALLGDGTEVRMWAAEPRVVAADLATAARLSVWMQEIGRGVTDVRLHKAVSVTTPTPARGVQVRLNAHGAPTQTARVFFATAAERDATLAVGRLSLGPRTAFVAETPKPLCYSCGAHGHVAQHCASSQKVNAVPGLARVHRPLASRRPDFPTTPQGQPGSTRQGAVRGVRAPGTPPGATWARVVRGNDAPNAVGNVPGTANGGQSGRTGRAQPVNAGERATIDAKLRLHDVEAVLAPVRDEAHALIVSADTIAEHTARAMAHLAAGRDAEFRLEMVVVQAMHVAQRQLRQALSQALGASRGRSRVRKALPRDTNKSGKILEKDNGHRGIRMRSEPPFRGARGQKEVLASETPRERATCSDTPANTSATAKVQ